MTREEAINECLKIQAFGISKNQINAMELAISALSENKGEWRVSHTDIEEVWATCSNCGEEIEMKSDDDCTPIFYNFCPNCGADMRGKAE